MRCVAGCCSVVQVDAGCCSVLQCAAGCCRVMQCVAGCGSVFWVLRLLCRLWKQCYATECCSVLQGVPVCCSMSPRYCGYYVDYENSVMPPSVAVRCSVFQRVAVCLLDIAAIMSTMNIYFSPPSPRRLLSLRVCLPHPLSLCHTHTLSVWHTHTHTHSGGALQKSLKIISKSY